MSTQSTSDLLLFVLDSLRRHHPIKARSLFGGYGLYLDSAIIGLITDTELYLKADAATAQLFIRHGSTPFSYERNGKVIIMKYWKVPEDILEDQETLELWVNHSLKALTNKPTHRKKGNA